ncbi:MAG: hypothetical protein KAG34_06165 [Cocleimonas sp.]|nr:hypothetical protein [Cocleimonas sp.]
MLTTNILRVRDETMMGKLIYEFDLPLPKQQLSVRDIIRERVKQEIKQYQQQRKNNGHSLVEVSSVEKILNKYGVKDTFKVDVKKQLEIAFRAFDNNGYFIIINEVQAETLEQMIDLEDENLSISFIKLVALVGG